jgi:hypothetical protein
MNITQHNSFFSIQRLNKYIIACKSDENKAILLYKYNIQLSQTLYPLISVLEIALRNLIDKELSKHFDDNNWLMTQRNVFANHPSLTYKDKYGKTQLDYFFSDKLRKAEEKLKFRQIPLSHGKILSELTFGFWVKFFDSNPIKILKGKPLQGFKNNPKMKLSEVHSHLNYLVTLRKQFHTVNPFALIKMVIYVC